MPTSDLNRMTPDEIVGEIRRTHSAIERASLRLGELTRTLATRARMESSTRTASEYARKQAESHLVYANAWQRASGVVVQAIRRTHAVDRTLDHQISRIIREKEKDEADVARAQKQAEQKAATGSSGHHTRPTRGEEGKDRLISALMELYGEDMIDASR